MSQAILVQENGPKSILALGPFQEITWAVLEKKRHSHRLRAQKRLREAFAGGASAGSAGFNHGFNRAQTWLKPCLRQFHAGFNLVLTIYALVLTQSARGFNHVPAD
jgi:hypothetical protein